LNRRNGCSIRGDPAPGSWETAAAQFAHGDYNGFAIEKIYILVNDILGQGAHRGDIVNDHDATAMSGNHQIVRGGLYANISHHYMIGDMVFHAQPIFPAIHCRKQSPLGSQKQQVLIFQVFFYLMSETCELAALK
jgi:hypothetical protein